MTGARRADRAWVYSRTSGDEDDTGQDCGAQEAEVKHTAAQRGFIVAGASQDDGVSGDSDPVDRPGFKVAMQAVQNGLADVVVVRKADRFTRQHPAVALLSFKQVQASGVPVVSLAEPAVDGRTTSDLNGDLVLYVSFHGGRAYLEDVRKGTTLAMREIVAGRRKTKSGRPPGREWKVSEVEARQAWSWMSDAAEPLSLRRAAHKLSEQRGAFSTPDPKLRRDRAVSHQALADRLADLGLSANSNRSPTVGDQGGAEPGAMGSHGDQGVESGDQATTGGSA